MHMHVKKSVLERISASWYWFLVVLTFWCVGFVKDCIKRSSYDCFIRIIEDEKL